MDWVEEAVVEAEAGQVVVVVAAEVVEVVEVEEVEV